jgi:hypothetical protein
MNLEQMTVKKLMEASAGYSHELTMLIVERSQIELAGDDLSQSEINEMIAECDLEVEACEAIIDAINEEVYSRKIVIDRWFQWHNGVGVESRLSKEELLDRLFGE